MRHNMLITQMLPDAPHTPDIITANGFIPVGAGSRVMVSVHNGNVRGARLTLHSGAGPGFFGSQDLQE